MKNTGQNNKKGLKHRKKMNNCFIQTLSLLFYIMIFTTKSYLCTAKPVGFSYSKFSGPVSGPIKEVIIPDKYNSHLSHIDYVGKPDYHFSYGVDDPKTKVLQNHHESRNGDTVTGEYR